MNCKGSLSHLLGGNVLIRKAINRHDLNEDESASLRIWGKKKGINSYPPPFFFFTVCGVGLQGYCSQKKSVLSSSSSVSKCSVGPFYNVVCLQGSVFPSPHLENI